MVYTEKHKMECSVGGFNMPTSHTMSLESPARPQWWVKLVFQPHQMHLQQPVIYVPTILYYCVDILFNTASGLMHFPP